MGNILAKSLLGLGLLLVIGCTEDPDILYSRAETEAELGSRQKALDYLVQIQRSSPKYTDAYLFAARLFIEDKNFPEAINQLKRGLDAQADSAAITRAIGEIYAERGSLEEAYRYLEMALAIDPDQVESHIGMGCILHEKVLYKQALEHFEAALTLKPNHYDAMIGRALALRELDETGKAIDQLNEAIEAYPMKGPAYGALAYTQEKLDLDPDGVADNYALAVRLAPGDQQIWLHYLDFLAADPDRRTVIKIHQRYNKLFPEDLDGYHRLTDLYLELATSESLSWLDAARQQCERALLLDKNDHKSHASLAKIYLLQEKPRLAVLQAQLAFEIQPSAEYRELIDQAKFLME